MNNLNFKKGDTVSVLQGKDKGKTGKIIEVDRKNRKVVVEGLNIHHKFKKATIGTTGTQAGQKISFPAPMLCSKLILLCPSCNKPTRVAHNFLENGAKQRICKKCGKAI